MVSTKEIQIKIILWGYQQSMFIKVCYETSLFLVKNSKYNQSDAKNCRLV